MATLVNNPKYGPGHAVVLKDSSKLSRPVVAAFRNAGYQPNVSLFEIAAPRSKPSVFITLSSTDSSKEILLKDKTGKIVSVVGSESIINGTFNHSTKTSKSETTQKTKLKEEISMGVFAEWFVNRKIATEDQATNLASKLGMSKLYESVYYESAIKQLNAIKNRFDTSKKYTFERQGENKTKWLYATARKLSKITSNDNWNPADVWIISANIKSFKDLFPPNFDDPLIGSIDALNDMLAALINSKHVYPISLKQVTADRAVVEDISFQKLNTRTNLDFSFSEIQIPKTYKNFILYTKSGFGVRVGFKASATTLDVSVEGRFKTAGFQEGAVNAKELRNYIKKMTNYYELRSGNFNLNKNIENQAMDELTNFAAKYPRFIDYKHSIEFYNNASELEKKRLINLTSYLYAFAVEPIGFGDDFENLMKYCYYSSKKISTKSSNYILIR